jgi:hypothetical protein
MSQIVSSACQPESGGQIILQSRPLDPTPGEFSHNWGTCSEGTALSTLQYALSTCSLQPSVTLSFRYKHVLATAIAFKGAPHSPTLHPFIGLRPLAHTAVGSIEFDQASFFVVYAQRPRQVSGVGSTVLLIQCLALEK